MWFESLTGFEEVSPEQVRANMSVDGATLTSKVNGRRFICGDLETPSLAELRNRVWQGGSVGLSTELREVVANVQHLHADERNAGALLQVASQFNLLEMVSPPVTPEEGVGIYEHDRTQGPACAIAAGAGTIFRNYFVRVNGQTGQSAHNQIDCLADLGTALGNDGNRLWTMQNGYAMASCSGLRSIADRLQRSSEAELDGLRQLLRVGIQSDTQVTLGDAQHKVTQAFCSALPVAYCRHPREIWTSFAKLVLEAAYEATICAGILNYRKTGNRTVFLTMLGGGAFGNDEEWILNALERAVTLYDRYGLDIAIVSFGRSHPGIRGLLARKQPRG